MSYPLKPHQQIVVDRLEAQHRKVNPTSDKCIRSSCPAHDGDDENFVVYFNEDGSIVCLCESHNCSRQEILEALGLSERDITPGSHGLTLLGYAIAKQLSPTLLFEYGVREVSGHKYPHIEITYLDFDGQPAGTRSRKAITERVQHQFGNKQRLYGMWRHASFSEYVVIVEGESDCHTLWSHGEPAVGVPGAGCVRPVRGDLEELVRRHPGLEIYVFQEPDIPGREFVKSFESFSFRDRIRVVKLGELKGNGLTGYKDASELHCANNKEFVPAWKAALEKAVPLSEHINSCRGMRLTDIAPNVKASLNKGRGLSRDEKLALCDLIADLLLQNDRLLVDISRDDHPLSYMISDDGAVLAITHGVRQFILSLEDCGLCPSESTFSFATDRLDHRAVRDGKKVKLERYSVIRNNKLYVSSGASHLVIAELDGDEVLMKRSPNGTDGVLFPASACFPSWDPACTPISLDELQAFKPKLEATDEAPSYTPNYQKLLLEAWLINRLAGTMGPIITCIGSRGSGKSVTLRAVAKLFMGPIGNVSPMADDQRSFFTVCTVVPVYILDNQDGGVPYWFANAAGAACTGANKTDRKLYSDTAISNRPVTAMLGVTSRNPLFASRPDMQDRLLPIFFGILPDDEKLDETTLYDEIDNHRSGIFKYLAERAAVALLEKQGEARGRPGRFQVFAQIADSLYGGDEALRQMELAKNLSVADDTLAHAIDCWFATSGRHTLEGTARVICSYLASLGSRFEHALPQSGQAFSIAWREERQRLEAKGYLVTERVVTGTKIYKIAKVRHDC